MLNMSEYCFYGRILENKSIVHLMRSMIPENTATSKSSAGHSMSSNNKFSLDFIENNLSLNQRNFHKFTDNKELHTIWFDLFHLVSACYRQDGIHCETAVLRPSLTLQHRQFKEKMNKPQISRTRISS